ncbi:MAG: hypothetical protein IKR19_07805 [Acholeplasmatales bacterium]|nr:hypothetical protein [Acholeplasmatales bacterium]
MDYDGIHAEDGEAEGYTELDGGIAAEGETNVPQIDVDAGHSYLGITDMDNIDGGEADEGFHTYYEIDGGDAYHEEDNRRDWYGTQGFNYDIDGGSCSPYYFNSRSLIINVINNGITMDVEISDRDGNKIMVLEDGLYVPDFMVNQGEFDQLVLEYNTTKDEFVIENAEALADIMSIKSFTDIAVKIRRIIHSKLYNMETSVDDVLNGKLEQRLQSFVNHQYEYLTDYYAGKNPYGWEEL